ncbi:GNAT family N-acetyltransferase [Devriesea agamarum]|uniref:GNAT family N-acetyltransferase n=1 Tax=Devriesea agamarum TaxID=472569 RepID=UPI00155EDF88|nr:GNAT family N-acetyltransferase [Devriesea agamarum]
MSDSLKPRDQVSKAAGDSSSSSAALLLNRDQVIIGDGPLAQMNPLTVYGVCKLRETVFSIEQGTTEPDLDGRDLDPDTRWVWALGPNGPADVIGHARILVDTPTGSPAAGGRGGAPTTRSEPSVAVSGSAAVARSEPAGGIAESKPAGADPERATAGEGPAERTVHIGRMVIHPQARRLKLGQAVFLRAMSVADSIGGPVEISAQAYLQDWYTSLGFRAHGDIYMEAGLEHIHMTWEDRQHVR